MDRIPKILHYCWFGGNEYSQEIRMCMASWKKYLSEYEFVEWNENNFDVRKNEYTKEAYSAKKYAFVTDYVRLYALYNFGGVYVDTDLEILRPISTFLCESAFSGFEARDSVPTAIMGSEPKQELIGELLDYYDDRHFIMKDGSYDLTTNVVIITNIMKKYGLMQNGRLQSVKGFKLYPQIYFAPNTFGMMFGEKPHNSYSIHHFTSTWSNKKSSSKTKRYVVGKLRNAIGTEKVVNLKSILTR